MIQDIGSGGESGGGGGRRMVVWVGITAVPALLISAAVLCIFAEKAATSIGVALMELRRAQEFAGPDANGPVHQVLLVPIERIVRAKLLVQRVADCLGGAALLGAIAWLAFGQQSRIVRVGCLVIVIALLIRAWFWEVV